MKRLFLFFALLFAGMMTAQHDSLINQLRQVGFNIEQYPRQAALYLQRAELLEQLKPLGLGKFVSDDLKFYKYVKGDTNNVRFLELRHIHPSYMLGLPSHTAKSNFITGTWICDSITSNQYDETSKRWQRLSDTTQHIAYTIRSNGEMLVDAPNGKQTGTWALFNDNLAFYSAGTLRLFDLRGLDDNLVTFARQKYNSAGEPTYWEYLHLQRK